MKARLASRGVVAALLLVCAVTLPLEAQDSDIRLRDAAARGQADAVRRLLSQRDRPAVDSPDEAGWTALMHAANAGSPAVVRLLLDAGARVGLQNLAQETALHLAARQGSVDVVRLLLTAGADFAARDGEGRTPLFYAINRGRADVIEVLHAAALARFNRQQTVLAPGTEATTLPPSLVHWEEAPYTDEALASRIEGVVVLMAVVGPDGAVGAVSVSKGLDASLDRNAVRAVRNWRFEPASRDGKPVNVIVEIHIEFRLPSVTPAARRAASAHHSEP